MPGLLFAILLHNYGFQTVSKKHCFVNFDPLFCNAFLSELLSKPIDLLLEVEAHSQCCCGNTAKSDFSESLGWWRLLLQLCRKEWKRTFETLFAWLNICYIVRKMIQTFSVFRWKYHFYICIAVKNTLREIKETYTRDVIKYALVNSAKTSIVTSHWILSQLKVLLFRLKFVRERIC